MAIEIKICGLSTAPTVEAALDGGADLIGLVFYRPSPRFVDVAPAAELAARARGRALVTALLVDATDDAIGEIVNQVRPDLLQLHGKENIERVTNIRARFGVPVMKVVGVSSAADITFARTFVGIADRLTLDAKPPKVPGALPGGNGLPFDWRLVADLDPPLPFMLSGGLNNQNVGQAVRLVKPEAVDVSSGVESAPGVKDVGKIRAFIAAARAAESELVT